MNFTGLGRVLQISFMATRNKVALRADPCGRPLTMSWGEDKWLLILTQNLQLAKKFLIYFKRLPFMSHLWSIDKTLFFHTVSYAFLMSRAIAMRCRLFRNEEQMSVCSIDSALSVEWLRLNPHCSLVIWFSDSKTQTIRLLIIFSSSLLKVLIKDIDL